MAAVVLTVISLLTFVPFSLQGSKSVYQSFPSPDKRFKIVVYRAAPRWKHWVMVRPGQGSDVSGLVCLYDVASGKQIERKRVEMVQMIGLSEITWSDTNVAIKLFADWKLPRAKKDR